MPQEMEDHWFMYCDSETIRYYRSWTGLCVYVAHYEKRGDHYEITNLTIDFDSLKERYANKEAVLFCSLIMSECMCDSYELFEIYYKMKKDDNSNENV